MVGLNVGLSVVGLEVVVGLHVVYLDVGLHVMSLVAGGILSFFDTKPVDVPTTTNGFDAKRNGASIQVDCV